MLKKISISLLRFDFLCLIMKYISTYWFSRRSDFFFSSSFQPNGNQNGISTSLRKKVWLIKRCWWIMWLIADLYINRWLHKFIKLHFGRANIKSNNFNTLNQIISTHSIEIIQVYKMKTNPLLWLKKTLLNDFKLILIWGL